MLRDRAIRGLFVNSGILGHRAVAGLIEDATRLMPSVDAQHINLSDELTIRDRVIRRLLSLRLTPRAGVAANLDLRRWREELNAGLLASRRIAAAERAHGRPFDVAHFHPQPTAYASLSRMKRTRAIVSIDATQQLASREAASRIDRATYRPNIIHDGFVFRGAAAITATSDWAARNLAAHYPECRDKLHVLPYPVRTLGDPAWIEERFDRSRRRDGPVRVLFMGGDFPRKGGFELVNAWRAADFGSRARLDLVTDWTIDGSSLPPGVRRVGGILPNTPPWDDLWRGADLFVMPTRHEAFGMVFQEAAAAGIPSIATDINAVPEIVQNGVGGILVPPGDAPALVAALRTLVDAPDLRRRMGAAALDRIRVDGALDLYARKLEAIIQSVTIHATH
jgi:glycosyltransferase involved in cell wall biosynthesis